jgi:hypothetical protein
MVLPHHLTRDRWFCSTIWQRMVSAHHPMRKWIVFKLRNHEHETPMLPNKKSRLLDCKQ